MQATSKRLEKLRQKLAAKAKIRVVFVVAGPGVSDEEADRRLAEAKAGPRDLLVRFRAPKDRGGYKRWPNHYAHGWRE